MNIIAILVVSVFDMVLGMLWYSPVLFGKKWMSLVGITPETIEQDKGKSMTGSFITAFIKSIVSSSILAYLILNLNTLDFFSGILLGFFLWLGFVAYSLIDSVLWAKSPIQLFFINSSFYLTALCIKGGILAAWL